METKQPYAPGQPVDRGSGYEQRDANVRGLLQFAFGMALVVVVTLLVMKWTLDYFNKIEPLGPPASPLARATQREPLPSPFLQVHPHGELEDYCAAQEQQVSTYGWVDRQSGVVRIPIDRAMDMSLQRGFPARAPSEAPPSLPPVAIPVPPSGADLEGQCGYLTEPSPDRTTVESSEAH